MFKAYHRVETNILYSILFDASEIPNNHLECIKPLLNNGINYQPQLVSLPDF